MGEVLSKIKIYIKRIKCPYRFKKPTNFEKIAKECRRAFDIDCGYICLNCGKRKKLKR